MADSTTTTVQPNTTTTSAGICLSETIYGEYSEQTQLLRYIRDSVLAQTPEGQEIIRLYYQLSPTIVKVMEQDDEFTQSVEEMIDGVLELVNEAQ